MAETVYSVNFFRVGSFTGGPMVVYTVPPGYRAVIKCVTIVYGDVTASGVDAWLQTAEGCKLCRYTWGVTSSQVANLGGTALFFGSWVLEPGEPLSAQTVAGTVDIQANGYQLSMP